MLERHGIRKYFKEIITKDDVKEAKPDPEGLLLCLKKLNIKKSEAFFVGDMTIDILMGRSVGVQTAIITGFSWNTIEDLQTHKPDHLLEKPQDIMTLL